MRKVEMNIGELMLLVGTRALLGAGLGLLLGERLGDEQRRVIGYTLLTVGLLTTIPLGIDVLSREHAAGNGRRNSDSRQEDNVYV